jgi:hypothetical protein
MLEVEIQQAMERYHDRLREAEENRLYQSALCANGYRHLRQRLATNLGSLMIRAGRRLGASDDRPDPSPAPSYSIRALPQFTVSWSKTLDCGSDEDLEGERGFRKIA